MQKIPLTDYEASKEGFEKLMAKAKDQFGPCFPIMLCLVAPFGVALLLFVMVLGVASIVFAIQALVVGVATYQGEPCENTVGVWLVVYGSLVVGSVGLNCLCGSAARMGEDDDAKPRGNIFMAIANLASLASFGWLCYGINLVYYPGTFRACNPSQFAVMEMMVLFMFYGTIAVIVGIIIMVTALCPLLCVLAENMEENIEKEMEAERQAELQANAASDAKKDNADIEAGVQSVPAQTSVNDASGGAKSSDPDAKPQEVSIV